MSKLGIPPVPLWIVGRFSVSGSAMSRHLVEVPDSFAIARWPRDADVAKICRCILGTLKYEPHAADTTVLRRALEDVIEHTARGGTTQTQQETLSMKRTQGQSGDTTTTDEQKTVDKSEMPPSLADVEAEMTVEQWLAIRKEAGLKIDPETAEVQYIYAQTLDPYGVYPDLPEEFQQVGREYFTRSPGSDVWVHFSDLPDTTRDALWEKHKSRLAVPAGLIPFELFPEEIEELFASKSLRLLRQVIMTMMADHGVDATPFLDGPVVRAVDVELVRNEFYRQYPADGDERQKASARRQAFYRAVKDAQAKGLLITREVEGVQLIWLTRPKAP